jgi:hypothetical protein
MRADDSPRGGFLPARGAPLRGAVVLLQMLVALLALVAGCQPARRALPGSTSADLVAGGRVRGLLLEDPLELDADIERDVEHAIGRHDEPRDRLHKLVRYLNDRGLGFKQLHGATLPVKQAFHERRGDCMTYAMLFVALSRHIGLETYFVHTSDVRAFYEQGNALYASSHIAVGFGEDPGYVVVDFYREFDDWQLAAYRRIDDAAAVALYFNNVAVYRMNAGRPKDAESLLSYLAGVRPNLAELSNNLVVADLRLRRFDVAIDIARRAIARFPKYKPLYTNAIQAAYGVGDAGLAHEYERRGQEIEATDPLFVFARGLQLYEREEFTAAATQFERALEARKDSVVIVAWLVRAHLSAGQYELGHEAFARAKRLAPGDRRLKELEEKFPELRAIAE